MFLRMYFEIGCLCTSETIGFVSLCINLSHTYYVNGDVIKKDVFK